MNIIRELEAEWDHEAHAVSDWFSRATRAPHAAPATVETTAPKGTPVSAITDVEAVITDAKNAVAKLEEGLGPALDTARKLEGNPVAQVALQAAEHLAAGVLPPEALALLAGNAGKLLGDLLNLYHPANAQAAPQQQPAA